MDKPRHPHVTRTWVVDRIRSPFLNPKKNAAARIVPAARHPQPPPVKKPASPRQGDTRT